MYNLIKRKFSKYCAKYLLNSGKLSVLIKPLIKLLFARYRCFNTDRDLVSWFYFKDHKSRLFLNNSSYIESKILNNGSHCLYILNEIVDNLRPNSLFIDVGANIGSISIPIATFGNNIGVEVISCEASKLMCKKLKANIGLNPLTNIKVNETAVFSHDRGVSFYEQTSSNKNMGLSSIKENHDIGRFVETKVTSITLDGLYNQLETSKKISVIKIDVQGAEYDVLLGSEAIIKDHRPVFIFEHEDEYHEDAETVKKKISGFFELHNYSLYVLLSNIPEALVPIDLSVEINTNIVALPNP